MTASETVVSVPSHIGNLDPDAGNYPKLVSSRDDLILPDGYLKWYDIALPDVDLDGLAAESREFLQRESTSGRLELGNRLGFLELHHCSSVVFLIVCTWHNVNELWQTTYIKDLSSDESFIRFTPEEAQQRPVFCVWELAPVWHERDAWAIYLTTARDATAKADYVASRFDGTC